MSGRVTLSQRARQYLRARSSSAIEAGGTVSPCTGGLSIGSSHRSERSSIGTTAVPTMLLVFTTRVTALS